MSLHTGQNGFLPPPNGLNGQNGERKVFLTKIFELLVRDGVEQGTEMGSKVVEFVHPEDLYSRLDLQIPNDGTSDERILKLCKETIQYSVKTGHRHFFNQLYSGLDMYGLAGAWLSDTLNTSQYTFEVAPVFTLMEQVVLDEMSAVIGYTTSDGIFCPGGSISNMYGLNLARFKMFPEIKTEGMQGLPRLCVFTSAQGHYSVRKGAALLGLGMNNVRQVPCDAAGKMVASELERLIVEAKEQGYHPFMVNGTSGTTVVGAYDPLDELADVCDRHGLWLHVDACWGGGALLSPRHKHLLKGIERADSISWNPHKMMGTPLQCCAFITKHRGLLERCNSAQAQYLFQQDKFYDISYDTGDKSIQCGRKVDVFKLWLMWKAKGHQGFRRSIESIFDNAEYLAEKIRTTEGFRLAYEKPECTNVCFWYIPPGLRNQEETKEWWQRLGKVAPKIKERMVMKGSMLVGYQPQGDMVNFFRMVISNADTTVEDMDFAIGEIQALGEDL